jgi:phosphatidylglycerol---prolipoprotein diacylglyceryl transferase
MRPILFVWRGIVIHSFAAMLYVGLLGAVFIMVRVGQSYGLNTDKTAFALVILLIPAFIGARIFYVLMHWRLFRGDLRGIWRRSDGGMVLYGGLVASVLCSIPLLWAMNLPFGRFWDALAPGMLTGIVIAKPGCLLNGCCSGRPTDGWCGVNLPDHRGVWRRRWPTQFIEMAWAGFILLVIFAWREHAPFAGAVFCVSIGAYGVGRFFLQRLRDDHSDMRETGILQKASILLALFAVIGGLAAWFR